MRQRLLLLILISAFSAFWAGAQAMVKGEDDDVEFGAYEISDEIFERIQGKSYKADCTVPLSDLRYLRVGYVGFDGRDHQGEMICNRQIAEDLIDIFRRLYEARYPIERIELIDAYEADDIKSMQANNTSCFNFRKIGGSKKLSKHALGLAVDINPLYNPYVKTKNGQLIVSPEEGRKYAKRGGSSPYEIDRDDLCYRLFKEHGFTWGGDWKSLKDYQHFEK